MGNYFLAAGLLLNSVLIAVNRWRHLPDLIYIPCQILVIALIIAGAVMMRKGT